MSKQIVARRRRSHRPSHAPTPFLSGLSPVAGKSLTGTFDAGRLSSDGGVIVLRETAERLGLAETITEPLYDRRNPCRVRHSYAEMTTARMIKIAAGCEDYGDIDALRSDPALKIAVGPRLMHRSKVLVAVGTSIARGPPHR